MKTAPQYGGAATITIMQHQRILGDLSMRQTGSEVTSTRPTICRRQQAFPQYHSADGHTRMRILANAFTCRHYCQYPLNRTTHTRAMIRFLVFAIAWKPTHAQVTNISAIQ